MQTWMWFAVQLLLALAAWPASKFLIAKGPRASSAFLVLSLAALLLWPLMRFFPSAPIRLLGASTVAAIELTGLFIPASLLFFIAAKRVPKKSDARSLLILVGMCALYFVRAGLWMVWDRVPTLGATLIESGVCRQTTPYTCVAASMVTMLRAHGIPSTEEEMARLSRTEVGGGATDSRALWALEQKLRGTPWRPRYDVADLETLIAAPKPCMVQIGWGFCIAHMVTVLEANGQSVKLGDPLKGVTEITSREFGGLWKGRMIWLQQTTSDHADPSGKQFVDSNGSSFLDASAGPASPHVPVGTAVTALDRANKWRSGARYSQPWSWRSSPAVEHTPERGE